MSRSLPTTARVIAIILVVMGVIGTLSACYGAFGLIVQLSGGADPQIPPQMSAQQAEAFTEYMEAAKGIGLWGAFPNVLSLFISAFMVLAGILTLTRKEIGLSPFAAFGAAVVDVLFMVFQIVSLVMLMPYLDGFMTALVPPGEEEALALLERFVGVGMAFAGVLTVIIGIGLAAFWGWAAISLRNAARMLGEDG